MKTDYLARMRDGEQLSARQQVMLVAQLSMPAIMAQISSIVMNYIDASMVGRLGSAQSASIGLMSSSTWLFHGVCSAAVTGFTVLVAQAIGANDQKRARNLMKQGFVVAMSISLLLTVLAASISGVLPGWLGGSPEILPDATAYFLIFALSTPFFQLNAISGGMLQASGNMRLPSILHVLMCTLDVVFNFLLIYPTREMFGITVYGAGLGVAGASLGTALAHVVVSIIMAICLLAGSPMLRLRRGERLVMSGSDLRRSARIAIPVAIEQVIMCGAQVVSTRIVAPLGTVAIAANSFGITVEALCYMPGYGIGSAASTLIGQSIGAGNKKLTRRLGWLTTLLGMAVMTVTGALMFIGAPWMIGLLSPDPEVIKLGAAVLRIEAFAEPFYAASIVASGVFRGAGDTLVPSILNFISMWAVRIVLAAILAPIMGLYGVWIAMCVELCVRGIFFLLRLSGKSWMRKAEA